jgi:uncharacterized caspase-like protein
MRKALIIGIDYYSDVDRLSGCVNDANAVAAILARHDDGNVNFAAPKKVTASGPHDAINRRDLRDAIESLFKDNAEIALLYFAGHGYLDATGGFICASDCRDGHDGLSLHDVMTFASESKAVNKVILLDSCHSGVVANRQSSGGTAEISEGMKAKMPRQTVEGDHCLRP